MEFPPGTSMLGSYSIWSGNTLPWSSGASWRVTEHGRFGGI